MKLISRNRYGLSRWARQLWGNLNHHGTGIVYTVPRLVGYIDMCADDDAGIQVTDARKFSNVLLAQFDGQTFSFSYDHSRKCVVVRENPNSRNQGREIAVFTDRQEPEVMDAFFVELTQVKRSRRVARAASA